MSTIGQLIRRIQDFYAAHARLVVAMLVVTGVTGWLLFLLVDEHVGIVVLLIVGIGLLPFLSSGIGSDGSAGPDPENTIGVSSGDFSSGPFLDS